MSPRFQGRPPLLRTPRKLGHGLSDLRVALLPPVSHLRMHPPGLHRAQVLFGQIRKPESREQFRVQSIIGLLLLGEIHIGQAAEALDDAILKAGGDSQLLRLDAQRQIGQQRRVERFRGGTL